MTFIVHTHGAQSALTPILGEPSAIYMYMYDERLEVDVSDVFRHISNPKDDAKSSWEQFILKTKHFIV